MLLASGAAAEDLSSVPLGPNADLGGVRLLPDDSPWNQDISAAPVDPKSEAILARIGLDTTPISAASGRACPLAFLTSLSAASRKKCRSPSNIESDPGPYPIPQDAPIEGGPNGDGDRHVLVLDRDAGTLFELFNAFPDGNGGWKAGSGAIWNLKENQIREAGFTSADAAGLPILPGLVRYDEAVEKGAIPHALRFTLKKTRRAYMPPASHWVSDETDEDLPPMGMRVRLKADYDISGFSPEARAILQALKTYGMILADNGSDNVLSGTHDPRWNADAVGEIRRVTAKDLEVVEMDGLVAGE